jgi:hypothetical protein
MEAAAMNVAHEKAVVASLLDSDGLRQIDHCKVDKSTNYLTEVQIELPDVVIPRRALARTDPS